MKKLTGIHIMNILYSVKSLKDCLKQYKNGGTTISGDQLSGEKR